MNAYPSIKFGKRQNGDTGTHIRIIIKKIYDTDVVILWVYGVPQFKLIIRFRIINPSTYIAIIVWHWDSTTKDSEKKPICYVIY